eukprot:768811-Hanusia_phi.AAC.2
MARCARTCWRGGPVFPAAGTRVDPGPEAVVYVIIPLQIYTPLPYVRVGGENVVERGEDKQLMVPRLRAVAKVALWTPWSTTCNLWAARDKEECSSFYSLRSSQEWVWGSVRKSSQTLETMSFMFCTRKPLK